MLQSFRLKFEIAYERLLEDFFKELTPTSTDEEVSYQNTIRSAMDALFLCVTGSDCQWINYELMKPDPSETNDYYVVVECKNIFKEKGYRTRKILKYVERDGSVCWWNDWFKEALDSKYRVIAWYKLPNTYAEYIE